MKKIPIPKLQLLGFSSAFLCLALGYRDSQQELILAKAIRICLECIGIG